MRIRVTKQDINNGVIQDKQSCPIALAVRRKFPKSYVAVHNYHLQIDNDRYWLTDRMVDFVDKFDQHKPVKPFDFNFEDLMIIDEDRERE